MMRLSCNLSRLVGVASEEEGVVSSVKAAFSKSTCCMSRMYLAFRYFNSGSAMYLKILIRNRSAWGGRGIIGGLLGL